MAEFGVTASTQWSLSADGAPLISFPANSEIAESDFYGKSAAPPYETVGDYVIANSGTNSDPNVKPVPFDTYSGTNVNGGSSQAVLAGFYDIAGNRTSLGTYSGGTIDLITTYHDGGGNFPNYDKLPGTKTHIGMNITGDFTSIIFYDMEHDNTFGTIASSGKIMTDPGPIQLDKVDAVANANMINGSDTNGFRDPYSRNAIRDWVWTFRAGSANEGTSNKHPLYDLFRANLNGGHDLARLKFKFGIIP
jgi:hypothetical protein